MMRFLPIASGALMAVLVAGLVAYLVAGPQQGRSAAPNAQDKQLAQAAECGEVGQGGSDDGEPLNAIARQAREWGISRCAREIVLVSS